MLLITGFFTKTGHLQKVFRSLDGSTHAFITFDNVEVPFVNVVGQPGEGIPRALREIGDVRLQV